MTELDLRTEYWAHYYLENGHQEEYEDDDFDLDQILETMEEEGAGGDDWEEVDLDE